MSKYERPVKPTLVLLMSLILTANLMGQQRETVVLDSLTSRYETAGLRGVHDLLDEFKTAQFSDSIMNVSLLVNVAVYIFQNGERHDAISLLEGVKEEYPDSIALFSVLGQLHWYSDNREGCIESFKHTLSLDSTNSLARRYLDLLFFVPDDFSPPDSMITAHLKIRPLTVEDVELDYNAVMNSREHIRGVFGPDDDWPADDLSMDDDLKALENHELEHKRKAAFTYTVMNHDESRCLGCIYLVPVHMEEFDCQVYMWVTKHAFDRGWDAELYSSVRQWIDDAWPFEKVAYPGREIDWDTWSEFDEY